MSRQRTTLTLLFALALPAVVAFVGGWATISVEDLPDHLVASQPTILTFTVRQHGVSPLSDLTPRVIAVNAKQRLQVVAKPTSTKGQYQASLVIPGEGTWAITVESGFGPSKLALAPMTALSMSAAAATPLEAAERGRRVFIARGCSMCHEHAGARAGEKALDVAAPELTGRTYPLAMLSRQVTDPAGAAAFLKREGKMPPQSLRPTEIAAIAEFLRASSVASR
jgi:hypothetical protein